MMFFRIRFILSVVAILFSTTLPAKDGSKINSEAELDSSPSSIEYLQLSGILENDENDEQIRIYPRNSNHMAYFLVKLEDIISIKNKHGKELEIDSLGVESVDKNDIYFINIKDKSKGQGIELDETGNIVNRSDIVINETYPLSFLKKAYPLDFSTSNAWKPVTLRFLDCYFSGVCISTKVCCSGQCGCWM